MTDRCELTNPGRGQRISCTCIFTLPASEMPANCDPKVDFSELAADVTKGAAGFCGGFVNSVAAGITVGSGIFAGAFGSEDMEDCVGAGFSSAATGAAFWATGAVWPASSDFVSGAPEFAAGVTDDAFTGVSVVS